jgi:hypothetical protein
MDDVVGYFNKMFDAGLRLKTNAFNKVMGGLVMVKRRSMANINNYELSLRAYVLYKLQGWTEHWRNKGEMGA